MKKINLEKIVLMIFILVINLFITNKIFAATLVFDSESKTYGKEEQFYVDLMLDTNGQSVNTIKGDIMFPSELVSFVRAEEGKSIVNLWIEKPKQVGNVINFEGVITNGFSGIIDPFNSSNRKKGLIVRLIFEAKNTGTANLVSKIFYLNLNDGVGTSIESPSISKVIEVGDFINKFEYKGDDNTIPELDAYVTRDPNIYKNKYVLIYNARDQGAGIKNVMIKEGRMSWKEITSPYLLKDQSRHSKITLIATNYSGKSISLNIDGSPYTLGATGIMIALILVIATLFVLIFRKIHGNKK